MAGGPGATRKQFLHLAGRTMLERTLEALWHSNILDGIVVAGPPGELFDLQQIVAQLHFADRVRVVAGGKERQESVWRGLQATPQEAKIVLVHDGVRPLVPPDLVRRVVEAAREAGAAIAALPVAAYLRARSRLGEPRIDYVFVDCPPSLGLLTVNAFVTAREVLIPIQCEYYALEGLSQLLNSINMIRAHLNPALHVSTIMLTMFDGRTNLAQQVAEEVREHFPDQTLRTAVPRSVRISEAPSYGQTVLTYDAGSTGAPAYLEAAREIARRGIEPPPDTDAGTSTATANSGGDAADRVAHGANEGAEQ